MSVHHFANEHHDVCISQERAKFKHVSLIIQNFTFHSRALNRLELATTSSIPRPNDQGLLDFQTCSRNNLVANFDHGLVDCFWVSAEFEATILVNKWKSVEHVGPGDADLIKHQPPIILGVVTLLGANITHFDSFKGQMCLHVSNWDEETLDTEVIFTDFALSKHSSMISPKTQTTRPVLSTSHGGWIYDIFIGHLIEGCCRFETLNVWTVSEFCLGVAPHKSHRSYFWQPLLVLFVWSQLLDYSLKHTIVEQSYVNTRCHCLWENWATVNLTEVTVLVDLLLPFLLLPSPLHLLFTSPLNVLRGCYKFRMFSEILNQGSIVLWVSRDLEEVLHLLLVEVALIALLLKVRVHDPSADGASFCVFFEMGALHYLWF